MVGFILGTGRCGSTLVHELVARHPATGFVTNVDDLGLQRTNRRQVELWRQLPAGVTTKGRVRFAPSEAYRAIAREVSPLLVDPAGDPGEHDLTPWLNERLHAFVDDRAARIGLPVFVHKFTGWPRAGLLAAAFPEARFVHVVRDGRAVASSWLQMPWWRGHLGPQGWHFGPLPTELDELWRQKGRSQPVLAGLGWRMLVDAHDRASADLGDRWLTVRYEDLLRGPRAVLTGILEHLGLEWTDAFAAGVGRYQLREERTQAFRHDLGPRHVTDLDDVIGEHLRRHGYPAGT
ncbi:MAG: sulfotransferase [Terracoccus sp.]